MLLSTQYNIRRTIRNTKNGIPNPGMERNGCCTGGASWIELYSTVTSTSDDFFSKHKKKV